MDMCRTDVCRRPSRQLCTPARVGLLVSTQCWTVVTRATDGSNSPACSCASPTVVRLDSEARKWLVRIAKTSSNFGQRQLKHSVRRSAAASGRTVARHELVTTSPRTLPKRVYHGMLARRCTNFLGSNRMHRADATTTCTAGRIGNLRPVSLGERDVFQLHRCAAGAHIVFIGTTGLGSMVMRGQLTQSVLNQSFAKHGARSTYMSISSPYNNSKEWSKVSKHFDLFGEPAACVIIKYSVAWVGAACRRRRALVLVDSIDNHRAYSPSTMQNEHYLAMDGVIVQTEAHAALLEGWGRLAVVLPHPHGNLGLWGVTNQVRQDVRGIGFVAQDQRNMPTREDMRLILRACCRSNVTLYLVSSRSNGLVVRAVPHPNCTGWNLDEEPERGERALGPQRYSISCLAQRAAGAASRDARGFATSLQNLYHSATLDPTRQRRYYESADLLKHVDIGLVWRPGHQQGGNIAIGNRPPTRLHWWWSHGLPAIGYPMNAYLEAAGRADYPVGLLNLTSSQALEQALRTLSSQHERSCLQRSVRHGASLSSPWYASVELLAAICTVARRCGRNMQLAFPTERYSGDGNDGTAGSEVSNKSRAMGKGVAARVHHDYQRPFTLEDGQNEQPPLTGGAATSISSGGSSHVGTASDAAMDIVTSLHPSIQFHTTRR